MLSASYAVHVNAPADRVWQAMAGVERWPDFAPQFRSIQRKEEGPLALSSRARVTPRGLFGSTWRVTEFEAGRSFTWKADPLPGLHLVAGHVVEPEGEGARAMLSLSASGPLATVLSPVLGVVGRRPRQLGEGLKRFCEGGVP
jgi:uncharacterized membrane protein